MKQMYRRTGLFLSGIFAMGVFFAGCTQGQQGTASQPGQAAGQTDRTEVTNQESQPQRRGSITVSVYDRGQVPAAEGTIEENRWTKWINENGPVDVKFVAVPRTEAEQRLNTLFAAGDAPDLIFEFSPAIKVPLYQQRQLMPIAEMIEKYSTTYKQMMEEHPGLQAAGLMDDGQLYQFGKINSLVPERGVVIRADWLKKLNLEVPQTIEDYYQVAKAFAEQDPDENGQKDTFGIALSFRAGETINQMFQTNTAWVVEDGHLVYGWDRLQARLDFQKRLYDEGIVDRDFLNDNTGAKAMQDFVNGKVGILPWLFNWNTFTTREYATLKQNVPEAELLVIPYPETEFGRFTPTLRNPVQMTAVVNAQCKDPEAVMQYVDFISSREVGLTLQYGLEGEHYEMVDGKPVIIDAEKHKNEVSYTGDFRMLIGSPAMEPYESETADFDLDDPLQKEGYELFKSALRTYLNPNVPYPELTHSEHMPQLPKELQVISANITLRDFHSKAIVSGSSYTAEQAVKDSQQAWERGGGKQIEEWMDNWYQNERHNAFLAPDIYEIMKSEKLVDKYK